MKIYEGTDGLRGLITKLIEVWDFKKIVYEGEGATLSTNDVVFNLWVTDEVFLRGQFSDTGTNGWIDLRTEDLTCPCVGTYSNISPKRRWVIYKQDGLAAIGIDGNQNDRPGINIVIGEVTDYETQEKGYGLATSCADNNIRLCSVFTDDKVCACQTCVSAQVADLFHTCDIVDFEQRLYKPLSHSFTHIGAE